MIDAVMQKLQQILLWAGSAGVLSKAEMLEINLARLLRLGSSPVAFRLLLPTTASGREPGLDAPTRRPSVAVTAESRLTVQMRLIEVLVSSPPGTARQLSNGKLTPPTAPECEQETSVHCIFLSLQNFRDVHVC
jgi:hypothetical protein